MNEKELDIRWKQRFQNFERAYTQFDEAVKSVDRLSVLEKEGMVQRFEYTFELAWKTLKDYLEEQKVDAIFPRDVLKKAFEYEILEDGVTWLEMMEHRDLMAHTDSEEIFNQAVNLISHKYHGAISQVYHFLKNTQCSV